MTLKNGIPEGGLRIGIKAGGCSGLSYTFSWEATPRQNDHIFEGLEGAKVFIDPKSYRFSRRHDPRLRHQPGEQGLHLRQPEREGQRAGAGPHLVCDSRRRVTPTPI